MKKEDWIWMPHAGHFICGRSCEFKLNTYVGDYIVSTVGQLPDSETVKYQTIGYDRFFETMVFEAIKSKNKCCPYEIIVEKNVDFASYNEASDAYIGHLKMCKKWSDPK